MKRLRRTHEEFLPLIIEGAHLTEINSSTMRGRLTGSSQELLESTCLRCPTRPCRASSVATAADPADLCPVGAVELASDGFTRVMQTCIGCGVCAVRCPVGAIARTPIGTYKSHPTSLSEDIRTANADEFTSWLRDATTLRTLSAAGRERFIHDAMAAAAPLGGRHFYPLVATLFKAIGIPARVSNQGDTSNRIDLVLTDRVDPIPVEVKSRTEVPTINTKSVQQALENKLAISRLLTLESMTSSSSLVVGFDYPSDRSGIVELIDDIEQAFGIRVGLVSLRRLYELLLEVTFDGSTLERRTLASLKGLL